MEVEISSRDMTPEELAEEAIMRKAAAFSRTIARRSATTKPHDQIAARLGA